MTEEEYFNDWSKVVNLKLVNSILHTLVKNKNSICPKLKDVFKAFTLCKYKDLRIVIIGQDPYFTTVNNKPIATGIAFGNPKETKEKDYSPSLKVLRDSIIDFYKIEDYSNFDPSLEKWEEQGVLMINSSLTCLVGKPKSHTLIWRPFIRDFLIHLSECSTGIVYVLMGGDAQSFEPYINKRFNHILKTEHPSNYARTCRNMPSDIWNKINNILIGQNGYGIKW